MMDNLNRILRQFKPILNNRGHILICRSPEGGGSGGAGGTGGAGDGGQANEFFNSIPEEVRKGSLNKEGKSTLEKFNSLEGLAKSYVELEGKIGAKGVPLPKDDSPEEVERFYNELGRPKTPAEYKYTDVANLHPKIGNAKEISTALSTIFHKRGLRNEQADGLNQEFLGLLSAAAADQEAKQTAIMQATEAQLRKDWSGNYDANKNRIGQIIAQMTTEEERKALGGPEGFGNNTVFLKIIHNLVSKMSEDTIKNLGAGTKTGSTGEMTKEQAAAKKTEMEDTTSELYKALMDERNPKHDEAVALRTKIYQVLHGAVEA